MKTGFLDAVSKAQVAFMDSMEDSGWGFSLSRTGRTTITNNTKRGLRGDSGAGHTVYGMRLRWDELFERIRR